MKRLLAASSLAILLVASSAQPASAWCSFHFGIGFNVGFSCGHGHHQAPPPCPFDLAGPGYGGPGGPFAAGYAPAVHGYAGYSAPAYGYGAPVYGTPTPGSHAPAPNFTAPQPTPLGAQSVAPNGYAYPASYQPLSYSYGYYPMSYSCPAYTYYGW
jgi:hypothetical protein